MKHLQETETSPAAYDTALRTAMTWMSENLHQHIDIYVRNCNDVMIKQKLHV